MGPNERQRRNVMPANLPEVSLRDASIEHGAMRKVGWRLVPFLMLCYFIAYVDRVNAGFAALTMNKDLGLSQAAFGLGAGLFYIAYILLEVPSNLAMEKVGARLWIARIMISWGIVGAATAFVVVLIHSMPPGSCSVPARLASSLA
jgi:sugar phosphate permease